MTLKQFGLPWTDQWGGGSKEGYVIEMISDAADEPLLELAKHLGVASQLETPVEPKFWSSGSARVFLSHLASMKVDTLNLREALADFGISAFVAHVDIEPTKEWQVEIESALASMDGLIALLAPGFKESNWCDQEVGVAIGRKLPIVSVRLGLDPYGFIGKYQAVQGKGKDHRVLARELYDIFMLNPSIGPKITSALVKLLSESFSFDESKRLISLIEKSAYLTTKHVASMQESVEKNGQVSSSWGVPEKIHAIAKKFAG
ncbi:MAG TPA: toll/interleukin-1 receptor domain-containing protein [Azonexus sp.]